MRSHRTPIQSRLPGTVLWLAAVGLLPLTAAAVDQNSTEKRYIGSIDNRFGIHMTLQQSQGICQGNYYYDRTQTPIRITGTIDGAGRIILDEFDPAGAKNGRFVGKVVSDGILAGYWTKGGSDMSVPFLLEAESVSGAPVGADDRAIVVQERAVLQRGQSTENLLASRKKDVVIRYPRISGLRDKTILARVQNSATLKRVLGNSIEDYKRELIGWLEEVDYSVNFNRDYILDITFWQSGIGAYPDTQYGHLAVNLKTGNRIRATDLFEPSSMSRLAALANRKLHAYIHQAIREFAGGGNDVAQDFPPNPRFRIKNLDDIRIEEDGITFLWEFGFPHVIKALEPPNGGFFFTYQELKPYLRKGGLITQQ